MGRRIQQPGDIIERTGNTTDKVTRGKRYVVESDGRITNDNGDKFMPYVTENSTYWIILEKDEPIMDGVALYGNDEYWNKPKENKMKIETNVTLIDGLKCDEYSDTKILGMIKTLQGEINALQEISENMPGGIKSERLGLKIEAREDKIEQLVSILDTRE